MKVNGDLLQYIDGIICHKDYRDYEMLSELMNRRNIHGAAQVIEILNKLILDDKTEYNLEKKEADKKSKSIEIQAAALKEAEYINKAFFELETARKRLQELLQKSDDIKKEEGNVLAAEKALHIVKPLENTFLREKKDQDELVSSIEKLKLTLAMQTPIVKELYDALIREQEKEPEREKLAGDISKLTGVLSQYDDLEILKQEKGKQEKEIQTIENEMLLLKSNKARLLENKDKLSKECDGLRDVETQLSECKNILENLTNLEAGLNGIVSEMASVQEMQIEYKKLQDAYILAEKIYNTVNNEYREKEKDFFRLQAGILAGSLKEGDSCPVCGSTNHPHKAILTVGAPSEEEIHQLKAQRDQKQIKTQQASEDAKGKNAEIETSIKHLYKSAGTILKGYDIPNSVSLLKELIQRELGECKEKEKSQRDAKLIMESQATRRKDCLEELEKTDRILKQIEETLIQKAEEKGDLVSGLSAKSGKIDTLLSGLEYPSKEKANQVIGDLMGRLLTSKSAKQNAEKAYHENREVLDNGKAVLVDNEQRMEAVAKAFNKALDEYTKKYLECGFIDENAYKSALLSSEEIQALKKTISDYHEIYRITNGDIARLSLETKEKHPKDITQISQLRIALQLEKEALDVKMQAVVSRLNSNKIALKLIVELEANRHELERNYLLVRGLSKTANGELSGKQKLAFEQYVQASYFVQIIIEANKRLSQMTNRRYELLRKEDSTDYRSQSGLELDVLDNYTGKIRSVKSLSGGESFEASLSLALGLSDVIQSYAGGVEIDTMFIDEGFGALDSQSLEQAVVMLSHLTTGNRLVGIISHVSELKDRIDKKVIIKKGVVGSTIVFSRYGA